MIIREVKREDLPQLQKVYVQLCDKEGDMAIIEERFEIIAKNKDYHVLVAEQEGEIMGTLMGIVCHELSGVYKTFMTIENVVVLDKFRRQGVARGLFERVEQIARQAECGYCYLVSSNSRKIAHQMYRKFGYDSDEALGFRKYF